LASPYEHAILQYKKDNMKKVIKDVIDGLTIWILSSVILTSICVFGAALVIGLYRLCGK
jgi:hypothetical protein